MRATPPSESREHDTRRRQIDPFAVYLRDINTYPKPSDVQSKKLGQLHIDARALATEVKKRIRTSLPEDRRAVRDRGVTGQIAQAIYVQARSLEIIPADSPFLHPTQQHVPSVFPAAAMRMILERFDPAASATVERASVGEDDDARLLAGVASLLDPVMRTLCEQALDLSPEHDRRTPAVALLTLMHDVEDILRTDTASVDGNQQADVGRMVEAAFANDPELASYLEEYRRTHPVMGFDERTPGRLLAQGHLRLVVAIAKRYRDVSSFEDLIQEGNGGLLRSVDSYSPERGEFKTYAGYCIRHDIFESLATSAQHLRLCGSIRMRLKRWDACAGRLSDRFDRMPTNEEIAAEMGFSRRQVRTVLDAKAAQIQHADSDPATTQQIKNDLEEAKPTALQTLIAEEEVQTLEAALHDLPERQSLVLRKNFGWNGDDPMTMEQIGELGLLGARYTKANISLIKLQGIKRLRDIIGME